MNAVIWLLSLHKTISLFAEDENGYAEGKVHQAWKSPINVYGLVDGEHEKKSIL